MTTEEAGRRPLRLVHEAKGGAFTSEEDAPLPGWYGPNETEAVASEYHGAREATAVADLSDRGALLVTGPLRQKFLHNILSNDVASLTPGQGRLAAVMDVKGHLTALLRVLVGTDVVRLEIPEPRLDVVEKLLMHYKVAAPVRFARTSTIVLAVLGPGARNLVGDFGLRVGPEAGSHASGAVGGVEIVAAQAGDLPAEGLALHVPAEGAAVVWSALVTAGAIPLGQRALDVLRIEDGRPWYGPDVTEENLLHETGLVKDYHSPTKGCYVGQEVIARLEARGGNVNKLLRQLRMEGPVSAGTPLTAEDREVGRLTTSGVSPRLGPIALAYVHRNHAAPGTTLSAAGTAVTVHPLRPA